MADLKISIGSELDNKGFRQADSSIKKLTKTVRNLGAAVGVSFGARAIVNYAKASVKAFAEDEKASKSLGITLKNLGLESGNTSIYINDMISRLEKQTGVIDDELRPAMDRLLRATGSITKSQQLLNLALDISAGTGKDLTAVSQGLQKAYLGNNASLGRLGVGLSKVELTSSSFEEIQKRLTKLFSGQATAAANSYAGQIDKLTIASNNAKEAIGKGLVDALVTLSGDKTIDSFANDMERAATSIADITRGLAIMIGEVKSFAGISLYNKITEPFKRFNIFEVSKGLGAASTRAAEVAKGKNPVQSGTYLNNPVIKTTNANTVAVKKLTAAQLEKIKMDKAAAKFDLRKIGLAAALGNPNISKDTSNRLRSLQAIENGDSANALKYGALIKPNASMASPNSTVVNVYPQGNILTEQDLINSVQSSLEVSLKKKFGLRIA